MTVQGPCRQYIKEEVDNFIAVEAQDGRARNLPGCFIGDRFHIPKRLTARALVGTQPILPQAPPTNLRSKIAMRMSSCKNRSASGGPD
jgi:hypothetical protein